MIIGINGYIGSGKDTVGNLIIAKAGYWAGTDDDMKWFWYDEPWVIKKFAGKLKEIASLMTGIPIEKFEDQDFKKSYMSSEWNVNGMPITVREFLQRLGTEAIRENVHDNAWVNALFADYKPVIRSYSEEATAMDGGYYNKVHHVEEWPNWIITDTRFPNEARAIKERGGIIIRVNRYVPLEMYHTLPNGGMTPDIDKSIMRHASEISLDDWDFDYVIDNSGSMDNLVTKVDEIIDEINHKNDVD